MDSTKFYSKSTGGFYLPGFHTPDQIPQDAVAIDESRYRELFAEEASGKKIVGDNNGNPVAVDPQTLLTREQAQAQQIGVLAAAYQAAIAQPIPFTSHAGVTKTYQADPQSIANLQAMIAAFGATQTVPAGFYWVSLDNTQVPFTYADMQGLAAVLGAQGWAAFQHLQTQKAAVLAAPTAPAALAVKW